MPRKLKIAVSLVLAVILYPLAEFAGGAATTMEYALLVVKELLLGLTAGYFITLMFGIVQLAGQLVDLQMGFAIVQVMDPQFGRRNPLIGNFLYLVLVAFFILADGHHYFIGGLADSFEKLPLGEMQVGPAFWQLIVRSFVWMFYTAVKISLPMLGILLLTTFILGIFARAIPQLNVFIVGLPLKIGVGLLVLGLFLSVASPVFENLMEDALRSFTALFDVMSRQ